MALTDTGTIRAGDGKLWIALVVSFILHALLLSLHFTFPEASRTLKNKALDIVLVNARSARKPTNAQVLAQANLDGGGTSDEDRVAKTPLPPSPREQTGNELEQAQKRVQELEAQQRNLLMRAKGKRAAPSVEQTPSPPLPLPQPAPETPVLNGLDLANKALEMTRLEGQIARQTEEYNKRPRVKHIGTSAEEFADAQYTEDWRIKVERVGTLNYPQAARGKLSGSLTLTVYIKSDGAVARIEIDKPSGHRVLDEAAQRIVRMAEPFARFPPDIRREGYDQISITRKWTFTSSNQLQTGQAR
jgi:protein TonB